MRNYFQELKALLSNMAAVWWRGQKTIPLVEWGGYIYYFNGKISIQKAWRGKNSSTFIYGPSDWKKLQQSKPKAKKLGVYHTHPKKKEDRKDNTLPSIPDLTLLTKDSSSKILFTVSDKESWISLRTNSSGKPVLKLYKIIYSTRIIGGVRKITGGVGAAEWASARSIQTYSEKNFRKVYKHVDSKGKTEPFAITVTKDKYGHPTLYKIEEFKRVGTSYEVTVTHFKRTKILDIHSFSKELIQTLEKDVKPKKKIKPLPGKKGDVKPIKPEPSRPTRPPLPPRPVKYARARVKEGINESRRAMALAKRWMDAQKAFGNARKIPGGGSFPFPGFGDLASLVRETLIGKGSRSLPKGDLAEHVRNRFRKDLDVPGGSPDSVPGTGKGSISFKDFGKKGRRKDPIGPNPVTDSPPPQPQGNAWEPADFDSDRLVDQLNKAMKRDEVDPNDPKGGNLLAAIANGAAQILAALRSLFTIYHCWWRPINPNIMDDSPDAWMTEKEKRAVLNEIINKVDEIKGVVELDAQTGGSADGFDLNDLLNQTLNPRIRPSGLDDDNDPIISEEQEAAFYKAMTQGDSVIKYTDPDAPLQEQRAPTLQEVLGTTPRSRTRVKRRAASLSSISSGPDA